MIEMGTLKEGIEAANASTNLISHTRELSVKASAFMAMHVVTLREDQSVARAVEALVKSRISGAPVLNRDGNLVGVISEFDCMKALAGSTFYQEGIPMERKVRDLMSRELHTISPDTDIFTIAHMFIRHRVRRLLVTEDGKLCGLVSRRDVLQVMRDRYC